MSSAMKTMTLGESATAGPWSPLPMIAAATIRTVSLVSPLVGRLRVVPIVGMWAAGTSETGPYWWRRQE
ncbi:MAG: hypothetical protein Ct9H300mP1_19000 [Planctomycetaceae bacterium]|nr:MAG: hypothetical protein Ct9H300mP1_19000 [Planctomycetaceae bacterium]